jgi:tetratricopeptide (TPR) repeat protein
MADSLSCLKKRDLLHNDHIPAAELKRLAYALMENEQFADALDFFEKAGDQEGIRRIREWSLEHGDPFLLRQTGKILKEPIGAEEWRKVGEKALHEGRFTQALTAFRMAGDEEKIQEIMTRTGQHPYVQPN